MSVFGRAYEYLGVLILSFLSCECSKKWVKAVALKIETDLSIISTTLT
jgi:hypothetical protein